MKGLIVAAQFMSRLPTPRLNVSKEEFAASIRWFPAVGLILGGLIAGGTWLAAPLSSSIAAIVGTILWVALTGGLHLDGLGDIADASGAAHKGQEHLSKVLADPHVGSFAITAIALQLLVKTVLLHAMIESQAFLAIALIPAVARLGPLIWSRILPSLHAGLGDMFRPYVRTRDILLWSVLCGAAALIVSPALLVAPLCFWGWASWIRRKIGGINGDGHGGGIEITESLLLFAVLIGGLWL